MNVAKIYDEHEKRVKPRTTIHFEGREMLTTEIRKRGRRLGNALKGLGIKDGEVVAVSMSNCPEVIESFAATFRIGAITVPILFLLIEDEIRYILEDSGAVAIITDSALEQKILDAAVGLESIRHIIVVGGNDTPRTRDYEALLQKSSPVLQVTDKDSDDVALIMYTSGTTALPKGVLLTHRNLYEAAKSLHEAQEVVEGTVPLLCLPLAHIYGISVMNTGAMSEFGEGTGVIMRWFDPAEFFRLVEKYGITLFPGVPTMLALLLGNPTAGDHDLSSLKDCISGSAPLPVELQRAFMERFDCTVRQAYGLTESSAIGAIQRPGHPHREGSAGKAYDTLELRIFDDDDNELGPGEIGELVLRGPQVMKGYLNRPEDTALALRGGWLRTGDLGYLDDEGFVYITDRKKDLIIKGGENIMPVQIEEVIYGHPAVGETAVIGTRDAVYGQEITAYVCLKPAAQATGAEILEFCEGRLASFKLPREVLIVESLPKSSVGKILKRELVEKYEAEKRGT